MTELAPDGRGATSQDGQLQRYAAVIFDMDGVVGDTEHLWDRSWTAYCRGQGAAWTHEDSVSLMGLSVPEWSAKLADHVNRPGDAEDAAAFCIDYIVEEVQAGSAGLMPGGAELVRYAASRVPVALATSSARPIITVLLQMGGLDNVFGATVSSAEVPRGKPSPDVYLEAARRIGVEGQPAIGVEDSANGIRAAHAAGLHVIAIPNRQFPPTPDALALADHVAADHADALAYLTLHLNGLPACIR